MFTLNIREGSTGNIWRECHFWRVNIFFFHKNAHDTLKIKIFLIETLSQIFKNNNLNLYRNFKTGNNEIAWADCKKMKNSNLYIYAVRLRIEFHLWGLRARERSTQINSLTLKKKNQSENTELSRKFKRLAVICARHKRWLYSFIISREHRNNLFFCRICVINVCIVIKTMRFWMRVYKINVYI